MKVARLFELVASSRGGGAVHVRDLALGLHELHYDVQVGMAEDGGNVHREDLEADGISFHGLDMASGFSAAALAQLRRLLPGVAILHMHGARAALFGRLALLLTPGRRPRSVYSIHGFAAPHYPSPRRQMLLGVERGLASLTDRWICVSEAERDALLAAGIVDPCKVQVIRNGIDISRFAAVEVNLPEMKAELGLPDDAYVTTTICRLFRPRDFDTLLLAFQEIAREIPSARLLIVGDGPLRPEIERQIAHLQLGGQVRLLGMRRDVPRLLRASNVLLLSSRGWEGLPLTVLEAMASGLPVVASDVGGTREALLDGKTGYLFTPGSVKALVERVLTLARNPQLAAEMGSRGLARVEQHFSLQRMIQETVAVYDQLV